MYFSDVGDGDTNINLDKYFYFPETNSNFTATNYKITLPNQTVWMDYSATQPAPTSPTPVSDPTDLRNDFDYDYDLGERHVWHTAKSTSKMPNRPPTITKLKMPPLTKIVVRNQFVKIQPKELEDVKPVLPILPVIPVAPPAIPAAPQKAKKKCIPRRNSVRGRLGTKNMVKISPTKEFIDALKDENIIYRENSEKPWVCKTCNRDYKWKNSLRCHQNNECGIQ